jgi:hypothetical protein
MPPTSVAAHPHIKDLSIRLTEADHSYIDTAGLRYDSVTTIIKGAFLPFNSPEIAARVAKREGGTAEEVMATWEMKRMEAGAYGTRFHANMEATIKGQPRPHAPKNEKEILAFRVGVETAKKIMAKYGANLWAEKMVFSPRSRVAGCIDLLACKSNEWIIGDWKTNETLKRENQYQSCAVYGLSHLPDCDFTRYSLQLSAYERGLRRDGYVPEGATFKRLLIHIAPGADKPEFIETPDMKLEMAEILLEREIDRREYTKETT